MTTRLAWKNIWRNKTRSLIFIGAAFFGLALAIFTINLMKGIAAQRLDDAVSIQTGHLQIQNKDFNTFLEIDQYIANPTEVKNLLKDQSQIVSITERMVAEAVLTTPENTSIAQLTGVKPGMEKSFSALKDYLIEGEYLDNGLRKPILVSKKTAERLKLSLQSKVIVTLKDARGEIVGGAFRVSGIFETPNTPYDENNAIVKYSDLGELSGIKNPHAIAILVNDRMRLAHIEDFLAKNLPSTYRYYSWDKLLPQLYAFNGFTEAVSMLFTIIILLGLGFGLLNTMNMIVQERTREIGMLRAIGQSKWSVFSMLVKESGFLMFIGSVAGILLGIVIVNITSQTGVPLGPGFAALGIRATIYPVVVWPMIIMVCVLATVLTVIISVFPAFRALRIKPHSALRDL